VIRALSIAAALALSAGAGTAQQATDGTGVELRVLDKITGQVHEIDVPSAGSQKVGHLTIALSECRYPPGSPNSDAWARMTIRYQEDAMPVFDGWMIASAPALNAMEHPRYDVWVARCMTS